MSEEFVNERSDVRVRAHGGWRDELLAVGQYVAHAPSNVHPVRNARFEPSFLQGSYQKNLTTNVRMYANLPSSSSVMGALTSMYIAHAPFGVHSLSNARLSPLSQRKDISKTCQRTFGCTCMCALLQA